MSSQRKPSKSSISQLEYQAYLATKDFTLKDWRSMRDKKYWITIDAMTSDADKARFRIQQAQKYKEAKRQGKV